MFVLSPDLVVLHALPGFWHPEDLARELRFAQVLARLWQDETRTHAQKSALFERMQLAATRTHPPETFARSGWQGFDAAIEMQKLHKGGCDTFLVRENGQPLLDQGGRPLMKPLNVLVHERMAQRPFLPFEDFDIAEFIDYGRPFYDNNISVDGRGRKLKTRPRSAARADKLRRASVAAALGRPRG